MAGRNSVSRRVPAGRDNGDAAFAIPKRVHFVGIGGVGMSGIAQILVRLGYQVRGSDLKLTEITDRLSAAGAQIFEGHRAAHVRNAEIIVTSSAVNTDNPEVVEARRRGIPVIPRAQMLARVARLKKTVTVAGSHGKTTTTSMAAMALKAAGADPTIVIGGQLKNLGTNARLGGGAYLVAEADESDGSFLFLQPLVAVVTNVDNDHLDHYKTMAKLKRAFVRHIQSVSADGDAIVCADDPNLRGMIRNIGRRVITYGIEQKADWRARRIDLGKKESQYDLIYRGKKIARVRVGVPGMHNVLNSLGAIAAAVRLGFKLEGILKGIAQFKGVGRRMDHLGDAGGISFYDDYGHHPTEIRATLAAVSSLLCGKALSQNGKAPRSNPKKRRLVVIFQPHRFSRTKLLRAEFGRAFAAADRVYVMSIYAAGEKPIRGVTSNCILDSLHKNKIDARPFTRTVDLVRELKSGDLVLTLGAGDVWKIGEDLRRRMSDHVLSSF